MKRPLDALQQAALAATWPARRWASAAQPPRAPCQIEVRSPQFKAQVAMAVPRGTGRSVSGISRLLDGSQLANDIRFPWPPVDDVRSGRSWEGVHVHARARFVLVLLETLSAPRSDAAACSAHVSMS